MNDFFIYTPTLAAKLIRRGFKLIRTEPSKKRPGSLVYVFENTLEFQLTYQELIDKK